MADVTLKIDADTARYIAKIAAAAGETKKLGKAAADSFGNAMGDAVSKSLIKLEVLKKVLRTIAQASDAVANKRSESSRRSGERAVSIGESLASLGVKDIRSASKDLQEQSGIASTDQRVAFLQAISDASESARTPIDSDTALQAAKLYARGGDISFGRGGKELIEGLTRGESLRDISSASAAKRPGLADPYLYDSALGDELGVRDVERTSELVSDNRRSEAGLRQRAGHAAVEVRASESFAGEFTAAAAEAVGARGVTDQIKGNGSGFDDVVHAINSQTYDLRRLNLPGQGETGP